MIIKYDPKTVENIAKFLNDSIEANKNEKYIMFIFNDIYENVEDIDVFYNKYVELMKIFDLPYAFYPYYIHFNKTLRSYLSMPSPRMKIRVDNNYTCDVVNQVAYGMLIVDLEKLQKINFKFNENYKLCFYIQDLVEACLQNNLYFSTSFFVDVKNSSSMVKSSMKDGYFINANNFKQEKELFYKDHPQTNQNINEFIEKLKGICQFIKEQEKIKQTNFNNLGFINPQFNNITVNSNLVKG